MCRRAEEEDIITGACKKCEPICVVFKSNEKRNGRHVLGCQAEYKRGEEEGHDPEEEGEFLPCSNNLGRLP